MLKLDDKAGFAFENNNNIQNSIKNVDPKFANYYIQKMNLRVKDDSPAKKKAMYIAGTDIVNVTRGTQPTIGAYE